MRWSWEGLDCTRRLHSGSVGLTTSLLHVRIYMYKLLIFGLKRPTHDAYISVLELCSMRSGVPRLLLGFYNSDNTTVGLLPWRRRFQPTAVTGTLPLGHCGTSSMVMVWYALCMASSASSRFLLPVSAPSFVSFRFGSAPWLLCLLL